MVRERELSPSFVVCRCPECRFVALDLDSWKPPYQEEDYYARSAALQIDPDRPLARHRVRRIQQYASGGRAVDLGCGLGETAINLQRSGFDAWGVDESRLAIERLQSSHPDVQWRCASVDDFMADCGVFDVVSLYHVLEHVPRPDALVRALAGIVRAGGLLVVEVPNLAGLQARLRGYRWEYWLDHHVNYFTPATLRRLIEPAGFVLMGREYKYHFNWPQGKAPRDAAHRVLTGIGFRNIVTTYWRRA
jgi:2-polyprenyl-3-methyl-5-hydroxy-6-metoxy-1,4-benzoquinol methylase